MSDSVLVALIVVFGWIISVCFHEFAHAFVAYIGGDTSVKSKGYLSFNPFLYTNIGLSIILPTLFIMLGGIGLPGASVQIREDQLHHRLWASPVAAAGPFATLLFALFLVAVIHMGVLPDVWTLALCWLLNIEYVVLLLNLAPIPGLDGFGIIEPFFSKDLRARLRPYYKHGLTIILVLLFIVPGANYLLWGSAAFLLYLSGINPLIVEKGEELYRHGAMPVAMVVIVLAVIAYFVRKKIDWYAKGEQLLGKENYLECISLMDTAIKKSDDPRAHKLTALCYASLAKQGKSDGVLDYGKEAETSIERCVALEPRAFENWLSKGFVLEAVGKPDEAKQAYEKSLSLNQNCDYAFKKICELLCDKKAFEEILRLCELRLKEMPLDADAIFYKGVAFVSTGRFEEALSCFDECIKMGMHKQLSVQNKILVLTKLGRQEQAAKEIESFLKSLPNPEQRAAFLEKMQLKNSD